MYRSSGSTSALKSGGQLTAVAADWTAGYFFLNQRQSWDNSALAAIYKININGSAISGSTYYEDLVPACVQSEQSTHSQGTIDGYTFRHHHSFTGIGVDGSNVWFHTTDRGPNNQGAILYCAYSPASSSGSARVHTTGMSSGSYYQFITDPSTSTVFLAGRSAVYKKAMTGTTVSTQPTQIFSTSATWITKFVIYNQYVFVSDNTANKIYRYAQDGTGQTEVGDYQTSFMGYTNMAIVSTSATTTPGVRPVIFARGAYGVYRCTSDTSCSQLFSSPSSGSDSCTNVYHIDFDSSGNLVLMCQSSWTTPTVWLCTGLSTPCSLAISSSTLAGPISGVSLMRTANIGGVDHVVTTNGHDNMVRKCPLSGASCTIIAAQDEWWNLQTSTDGTQVHFSSGNCGTQPWSGGNGRNCYAANLGTAWSGSTTYTCPSPAASSLEVNFTSGGQRISGHWWFDANKYSSSGNFYAFSNNQWGTAGSYSYQHVFSCPASGGACTDLFALSSSVSAPQGLLVNGPDFLIRGSVVYRCDSSGSCSTAYPTMTSVHDMQREP